MRPFEPSGPQQTDLDQRPKARLEDLVDRYEAFLFDAYGVLVDKEGALPGAINLLKKLQRLGKPYGVVTNSAAHLPAHAARRYQAFGLPLVAEDIVTAGSLIAGHFKSQGLEGRRCAVLGPRDSWSYVEAAGAEPVQPTSPFDVLVIGDQVGFPFLEFLDATLSHLIRRFDANQPVVLVLPNPDLIYPQGAGVGLTAGALAVLIEAVLAQRYPHRGDIRFTVLGKPQPALIEAGLARVGTRKALLLGDQRSTDIRAARAVGIDSVLLLSGVTTALDTDSSAEDAPTYVLQNLLEGP